MVEALTPEVAAKEEIRRVKSREGVVVSDKMDKTVTVAITRLVKHKTYGKFLRRTKKVLAHDQKDECQIGDLVRIVETRPMSARKRWKVDKIVKKAEI
jgi:small subunit ribosomal protein S17